MPEFQLLRCSVALGGDLGNIVVRNRFDPIIFPELSLLQYMHGDDAVFDVHVVGTTELSQADALARLQFIYASKPENIRAVYPGERPRLPTMDPGLPICTQPIYKAPPTRPDNPDPKLKPLVIKELIDRNVVIAQPDPAGQFTEDTEVTADEIAAHVQDTEEDPDPGVDQFLLGAGQPAPDMPRVQDQVAPRTNVGGMRAPTAPRSGNADHLPDVEHREPRPRENRNRQRAA